MAAFLQVSIASFRFVLCVVYARPQCSVSVFRKLWQEIGAVTLMGLPVLIVGDFNARHPELGDIGAPSSKGSVLLEQCDLHALTVLNTRDCWGVGTRGDSVLDLAITNAPHLFALRIGVFQLNTDHLSLSVTIDNTATSSPPASSPLLPRRYRIKKADWEMYNNRTQHYFDSVCTNLTPVLARLALPNAEKQGIIDEAAKLIQDGFVDSANSAVPLVSEQQRVSKREMKLADMNTVIHTLHNRLWKAKWKVRKDNRNGNDSIPRPGAPQWQISASNTLQPRHSTLHSRIR
jgi:hypothetical protein